jgi:prevent-host-death family protein
MATLRRVGVRELRQNLSVYLRRVAAGRTYEVTERGRPVAVLAPHPDRASVIDRLEADGRLRRGRGELAELGPALAIPLEPSLSDLLQEQREE